MLERLQASSLTPSDSTKLINHLARSQTHQQRSWPHVGRLVLGISSHPSHRWGGAGGPGRKVSSASSFFWLCEVSCAWPTASAGTHPIYVYVSSSHLLWQQSRGHRVPKIRDRRAALAGWENCGLMTLLKAWALQIRDTTGASAAMLQSCFCRIYLTVSASLAVCTCPKRTQAWNLPISAPHKPCFGIRGKRPRRRSAEKTLTDNPPLKVQSDLVKTSPCPTFPSQAQDKKVCWAKHSAVEKEAQHAAWGTELNGSIGVRQLLLEKFQTEWQPSHRDLSLPARGWEASASAEENGFSAPKIPLWAEMFYEIMFMSIITSAPIYPWCTIKHTEVRLLVWFINTLSSSHAFPG